jgi:hypothetical protein
MHLAHRSRHRDALGRRLGALRRLSILGVMAGTWLLTFPGATVADTYGPCQASATIGGASTDITALSTWHTRSTDQPVLAIVAPFKIRPQSDPYSNGPPRRYYWLAGLGVDAEKGVGGSSPGTTAPLDFAPERLLGARFNLNSSIDGPDAGDQCSWSAAVVLDDVNALLTIFGGGALLLALIALVAIVGSARVRGRWWLRIGLGVLGAVGGIAAESALEQFAVIPWKSGFVLGIGLAVIGLVAGLLLVGLANRSKPAPPTGPSWGQVRR